VFLDREHAQDVWNNVTIGDTVPVIGDVQGYIYVDGDFKVVAIEGSTTSEGDDEITITVEDHG
jgi:hypothetical protein